MALLALTGCTTAQLAQYEKGVDSRSIEGYAKEGSSGGQQGGIKYTVHYR
jgi:hypothetical protein